jgi:hypothetical protein
MTKTETIEAAIALLQTEAGIEDLFNELLVDSASGSLNREQYAGLMERIKKVWTKLDNACKADAAANVRAMMDKFGLTASDLGFTPAATPKTPKKEGETEKQPPRAVWFMRPDGTVDHALDNRKGGYISDDVQQFVDFAKAKLGKSNAVSRGSFLVSGDPSNADLEAAKVLTKEEFIAKVERLGINPTK